MQCFTPVGLICTSAFTRQHINHTCHFHYGRFLFSLNDFQRFLHVMYMQLHAMPQYACSGPTPHKPTSLIMSTSGFLQHASMASSRDWEWDILDMKASCIMALQLALDLQARWLTPVQLNRPQPWMSPSSLTLVLWLLQGPRQILWWVIKPNCLYGWLAPRSWMTNITVPPLLRPLLSSHSSSVPLRALERIECVMFSAVWSRLEYIVSLAV